MTTKCIPRKKEIEKPQCTDKIAKNSKETPSKSDGEARAVETSIKKGKARKRFSRPAEFRGQLDKAIDQLVEDARKEAGK